MKLKSLYSWLALLAVQFTTYAQTANFNIAPFVTANTSIKEGQIEVGPEFIFTKVDSVDIGGVKIGREGNSLMIRPTFRLPLTNKTENIVQIDRFTNTWRSVLALQYTIDKTKSNGIINRHSLAAQFEYGYSEFKYYPTGNKANESKNSENSFGGEIKYVGFWTQGKLGTKQISPQFRLRYSKDWKSAKEVGVVNSPNPNGITTTTNMIIDEPSVQPIFSPAFTIQFYPGKSDFSYAPVIYYDLTGKKGQSNPFNNLNRLRIEFWTFYYPLIKDNANVKIGVSPFISIRTKGNDDFNKFEYGGLVTLRFNTSFLNFF